MGRLITMPNIPGDKIRGVLADKITVLRFRGPRVHLGKHGGDYGAGEAEVVSAVLREVGAGQVVMGPQLS
jgi:hypothetical protein